MKKIKENKGITLIALIITIIVLLILAVVAINAVQGDGIIAHAKNARDDYQTAQEEENTILGNYLTEIEKITNGEKISLPKGIEYYVERNVNPDKGETYINALCINYDENECIFYGITDNIITAMGQEDLWMELVKENKEIEDYGKHIILEPGDVIIYEDEEHNNILGYIKDKKYYCEDNPPMEYDKDFTVEGLEINLNSDSSDS